MKKRPEPTHPGEMLSQARIRAGYNVNVVIARLSVTEDVFEAIEDWRVDDLPDNAHLIPILKRHAEAVDISYTEMTKRFPDALESRKKEAYKQPAETSDQSIFVASTVIKIAIGVAFISVIAGYILWQGSSLSGRPRLEITAPTESIISSEFVTVTGETSQGSQVLINGSSVLVNEQGLFMIDIVLQEGTNTIAVRAVNNVGAEREEVITVLRR